MTQEIEKKDLEVLISNCLRNLGIISYLKGYNYLIEAIILTVSSPSLTQTTKVIYKNIADKFNSNSSAIEKCIRTAIHNGWPHSNPETIKQLFGNSVASGKTPTNACFIKTISDQIKVGLL